MTTAPVKHGKRKGSPRLGSELADAFAEFGPAYVRWIRSHRPAQAPSYPRLRLLNALQCNGPQIMSALSEELDVTPRNITALVDGLEAEGLVRRTAHPSDRRATIVELTPRGDADCRASFGAHRAAVADLFEDLSEDDQRELLRLIGELREAIDRRERREAPAG